MEEIVKNLTEQVRVLKDTQEAMINRQEQLFKMQEAKLKDLTEMQAIFSEAKNELEVTTEALRKALSEADSQIDDLAKVTAALLMVQQNQPAAQNA